MSDWYEIKKSSSNSDFEQWYRRKFAELCLAIEFHDSVEIRGDIHLLEDKLSPYLNSEKEYRLLAKEFYGKQWLTDYIENWQNHRNSKALIIYGNPGSGKSPFRVIIHIIIQMSMGVFYAGGTENIRLIQTS